MRRIEPSPPPDRPRPTLAAALAALATAACAPADPVVPLAAAADRGTWPSEAELTRLQPADRHFDMGYKGQDIPLLLAPAAVNPVCGTVRRTPLRLRCRYALTVVDWIGPDRPVKPVEDLVERGPDGTWRIVRCPPPGLVPGLAPPPDPSLHPGC